MTPFSRQFFDALRICLVYASHSLKVKMFPQELDISSQPPANQMTAAQKTTMGQCHGGIIHQAFVPSLGFAISSRTMFTPVLGFYLVYLTARMI
ncbi:unnamed protein product [Protopolystoma xenopodis]|uniref:Uncharacterized protein n=1 Tax=Protopolystoma xenopodis TaxID=117903 RepID=A0A3S4ZTJ0_9PLAT|nr:unnamed protein product [Protopolystoma xenopodis]